MKNLIILSMGTAVAFAATLTPALASDTSNATISSNLQSAPLTLAASDDLSPSQLPPPVLGAIRSQGQGDPIRQIKTEVKNGETVYRIKFERQPGRHLHPELVIAANGTVLQEKHMGNIITEPAGASMPRIDR